MGALIDETGNRYGRLVIIERAPNGKHGAARWLCQCDCGGQTVAAGNSLRSGHTKSCGCWQLERTMDVSEHSWRRAFDEYRRSITLPEGDAAFNKLYAKYETGATKRGLNFDLSKEQFRELTEKNCYYCGVEPQQIMRPSTKGLGNGVYVFNGIDRRDNNQGYTYANCLPCCGNCNRAKAGMSYADFVEWLDRIAAFRSVK